MSIEKVAGAQDALLDDDELLADDVPLFFGIRHPFERLQEFGFGFLNTKRRRAELLEQAPHIGGLTFAHQPGIHVDAENPLGSERPQAQRVGHRGVHSATDKEEYIAVRSDGLDLLFERPNAVLGIPILGATADPEDEICENLMPLLRVRDFRMELHGHERTRAVGDGRHGTCKRAAQDIETFGSQFHLVAMIHPDLQLTVQTGKKRVRAPGLESGESILALLTLADAPAQHVGHQLLSIADAEHRATGGENLRIDLRAAGFVNAVRTPGDDNALPAGQLGSGRFAGLNIGIHAEVANLPGDQMTVLAARVEDGNLWCAQTFANV